MDDAVRRAAFALVLRHRRPVSAADIATVLAASGGEAPATAEVALVVDRLGATGQLDRDAAGAVIGSGGLTLGDGPHGLLLGGREFRTWCAYDAIGIAAALGADAIEVWNEPNLDREWPTGQISGAGYVRLLQASHAAIKGANTLSRLAPVRPWVSVL